MREEFQTPGHKNLLHSLVNSQIECLNKSSAFPALLSGICLNMENFSFLHGPDAHIDVALFNGK